MHAVSILAFSKSNIQQVTSTCEFVLIQFCCCNGMLGLERACTTTDFDFEIITIPESTSVVFHPEKNSGTEMMNFNVGTTYREVW